MGATDCLFILNFWYGLQPSLLSAIPSSSFPIIWSPHTLAASQSLLIMYFKNNLSPGEWWEDRAKRKWVDPGKMLEAASKMTLTYAYLREKYAIRADELLGNPDPHFMQIDPVIKNSKRKQQQNVTFQRH